MVLADIDLEAAQRTAAELGSIGPAGLAVRCDVADENQVDAAVGRAVEEFGGVDILINNAGKHLLKYNQPFSVLPRDEVRALFDVNVVGVINCSVACRESMSDRGGGAILNIASIAAHLSTSPYGVSKLAVRGLTIAFAAEFAPHRIRVNAISPGLMATENAMAELPAGHGGRLHQPTAAGPSTGRDGRRRQCDALPVLSRFEFRHGADAERLRRFPALHLSRRHSGPRVRPGGRCLDRIDAAPRSGQPVP